MSETSDQTSQLADQLTRQLEAAQPDASGPLQLHGGRPGHAGEIEYELTAMRLLPIDTADPSLADVYVPVPVNGRASVSPAGEIAQLELSEVEPAAAAEARAWARSLLASGAVAGVSTDATGDQPAGDRPLAAPTAKGFGRPGRPTHELAPDGHGRRVLRRVGYVLY